MILPTSASRTADNLLEINVQAKDVYANIATSESRSAVLMAVGSHSNEVFKDRTSDSSQIQFSTGTAKMVIAVTRVQSVTVSLNALDNTPLASPQTFSVVAGKFVAF